LLLTASLGAKMVPEVTKLHDTVRLLVICTPDDKGDMTIRALCTQDYVLVR
jgi:hypothetical protein